MTLNGIKDEIRIVLGSAVTTNELDCTLFFSNSSTPAIPKGRTLNKTNGTTPVTLLSGEQGTTSLSCTSLSVHNTDTVSATVTISYYNGSSNFILKKQLLTPGQSLEYTIDDGFFLKNRLFPLTAKAAASATVGTASTSILASNTNRMGCVITNTGIRDVFIGIGASAVLNQGIFLSSNGGVWVMDDYTFTTQAINGIVLASTTNVSIQEFE